MAATSPATYALLGLLATRPWTGYELTQQVGRSLRFAWPTSQGHLYREQKRLVSLGWAEVDEEQVGERTRNRYAITGEGRLALRAWLATEPQAPQFHIEGVLRAFYGDRGEVGDLTASLRATSAAARELRGELADIAAEYLEDGGPLTMIERGARGDGERPPEFHGRPVFPERVHVVAIAIEALADAFRAVEASFDDAADDVASWSSTTDPTLTARTRARLERVRRGR